MELWCKSGDKEMNQEVFWYPRKRIIVVTTYGGGPGGRKK